MQTSLFALARKHYFVSVVVSFAVLFGATSAVADIISGSSSVASSNQVTTTVLTIGAPANTAVGDILIANVAVNKGNAVVIDSEPSGWTLISRTDNDANITMLSYWKLATNGDVNGTYTWKFNDQTQAEGGITAYTGVDQSNPIDATAASTGFSSTAIAPSITTTADNEQVIALYAMDFGKTAGSAYFGTPTGMTQKYNAPNAPYGPSIAAFDVAQASAGLTGAKSSTIDPGNKSRNWVAQQFALRRAPVECTGGTISYGGGNTIHTFSATGTSALDCTNAGAKTANILVVGGGGGGGANAGAGGGAGGYISSSSYLLTESSHTVVVGDKGRGCHTTFVVGPGPSGYCDVTLISNGGNSQFDTQIAYGGGYGSSGLVPVAPSSGGSGGGGSQSYTTGGAGTAGQGNAGGNGLTSGPNYPAGGGGGASEAGVTPASGSSNGGNGGAGYSNNISGSTVWYAGGGGAGRSDGGSPGTGGIGGGGDGSVWPAQGGNAADNTGGGGGGSGGGGYPNLDNVGGDGGTGIVIVSYPTP